MNNSAFLQILKASFITYLNTSPRSNEKLKILHGAISKDLSDILQEKNDMGGYYSVASLGFGTGSEAKIAGRYVDKAVDITVGRNGQPVAGIAVKYVMSNYMQNSNNYFENMLGETANIRCNRVPYFQIFIIPDEIPYYDQSGFIKTWERINAHNLHKYITLSEDNIDIYMHTPNKTLVCVVNISSNIKPAYYSSFRDRINYRDYYINHDFSFNFSNQAFAFADGVVYNDYEAFIRKVVHSILSL